MAGKGDDGCLAMVGQICGISSDVTKQQEEKMGSTVHQKASCFLRIGPTLWLFDNLLKQHPLLVVKCSITWNDGGPFMLTQKLYLLASGWKGM